MNLQVLTTYIILRQQTGTELEIVVQVKGSPRIESCTEGRHSGSFGQFLHAPHASKLTMGVLRRRQSRRSSGPTSMVMMRRGSGRVRRDTGRLMMLWLLLLLRPIVVARHDLSCLLWWCRNRSVVECNDDE